MTILCDFQEDSAEGGRITRDHTREVSREVTHKYIHSRLLCDPWGDPGKWPAIIFFSLSYPFSLVTSDKGFHVAVSRR